MTLVTSSTLLSIFKSRSQIYGGRYVKFDGKLIHLYM